MYKIHNNLTPSYLRNNLSQFRGRPLRNANDNKYQELMCNSTRFKNSFFPDAIKSWNSLGINFSSSQSIGTFKKSILDLVRPSPKSCYGLHDPNGLKYIFQLRVGLSALKFHKKHHNFADTPDDQCDCLSAKEDTFHFLFTCPLYATPRVVLNNSVAEILIKNNLQHLLENAEIYLYGHASLHAADNKTIILSTIKFIKESNRFS